MIYDEMNAYDNLPEEARKLLANADRGHYILRIQQLYNKRKKHFRGGDITVFIKHYLIEYGDSSIPEEEHNSYMNNEKNRPR
jgi:hypothetical protein